MGELESVEFEKVGKGENGVIVCAIIVDVEDRGVAIFTMETHSRDVTVRDREGDITVSRDIRVDEKHRSGVGLVVVEMIGQVEDLPILIGPSVT